MGSLLQYITPDSILSTLNMGSYTLTEKQHEIIKLIYRFRFLDRIQIQHMMNHKDYRRINAWLKNMTDTKYLGRIYSTDFYERTKPAIYYLSKKGIQYLHRELDVSSEKLKKYYSDKSRSNRFIEHCRIIGEINIMYATSKQGKKYFSFYTKVDIQDYEELEEVHPDAYIKIGKNPTKRFFFDIVDSGTPRFFLRYKIDQYIKFDTYGEWEAYEPEIPFPTICLICPDERTKRFLSRYITQRIEETGASITFLLTALDHRLESSDVLKWVKIADLK